MRAARGSYNAAPPPCSMAAAAAAVAVAPALGASGLGHTWRLREKAKHTCAHITHARLPRPGVVRVCVCVCACVCACVRACRWLQWVGHAAVVWRRL